MTLPRGGRSNKIFIDGDYVSVTVKGEGNPVIFLHGYLSCKESFYYQIKAFSPYFKCIAPDMPAFGASGRIERAWDVGDYARWLTAFLAETRTRGAYLVAHSFGARVAIKALAEDNSLFSKVVLTGAAGLVKERSPAYIRRVKRYRRVKKFFPKYAERHFGSEEYRTLSPLMRESYKKIVNEDLSVCAAKICNPVLLIYGANDSVTPAAEEGETFRALMPRSRLEILEGGHFCFSENYTAFNASALAFFARGIR